MSVIIAKAGSSCSSSSPTSSSSCLPAITAQALVAVSTTINVDFVPINMWCAAKWYVVIMTMSSTRLQAFEIYSTTDINGTSYNTYAIMGDSINQSTIVYLNSGTNLTLQVTNNDTEDFIVYATRLAIPTSLLSTNNLSGMWLNHIESSVAAGTTEVIDTFIHPNAYAVKWLVSITDANNNKVTFQVYALLESGGIADDALYGIIGDLSINYVVAVNVTGVPELQLVITNNDLVGYRVTATRISVEPALPPSCLIPGEVTPWLPNTTPIVAGITSVVDSQIAIPGHDSVKWLVGIVQPSTSKIWAFEIDGYYQNFSNPNNLMYSMVGSYLNIVADVSLVGLNMVLSITNNELSSIQVYLVRLPVSI